MPSPSARPDSEIAAHLFPKPENIVSGELRNFNPNFSNMLNGAWDRIYKAWLPHVSEAEARDEADRFASRFHLLIDGPLAPLTSNEFEAVLDVVADAMASA